MAVFPNPVAGATPQHRFPNSSQTNTPDSRSLVHLRHQMNRSDKGDIQRVGNHGAAG